MNWQDINTELATLLDDADAGSPTYPPALRLEAFNRAQEFFAATHTAPIKTAALTATTVLGAGHTAALPDDLVTIGGVECGGEFLRKAQIVPGKATALGGYMQLDRTTLFFPDARVTSATLWYYAFYARLEAVADECLLPRWAEWPVVNLALGYLLYPSMIGEANYRQYQSKRDAGQPEDNPTRLQAQFFMDVYARALAAYKPQDREAPFGRGA